MNPAFRILGIVAASAAWIALILRLQTYARAHFPESLWATLLIGGLAGLGFVLILALLSPRRYCEHCRAPQPRFRKPTSLRQLARGGWTCKSCQSELSNKGRPLKGRTPR